MKFYQTLNQAPRSAKHHGKYRRPSSPAHGRAVVGADYSPGGADEGDSILGTFTWVPRSFFTWDLAAPDPKPPTIPYAGIRTGELIGHRLWWVIHERGEPWLCSLAHRQLWNPGETVCGDTNKCVDPHAEIWGGVYAFGCSSAILPEVHDMRAVIDDYRLRGSPYIIRIGWYGPSETSIFVSGTIRMWGDTVEHERGYRSEFAKLNSLDAIYGPGDLDALRAKYLPSLSSGNRE